MGSVSFDLNLISFKLFRGGRVMSTTTNHSRHDSCLSGLGLPGFFDTRTWMWASPPPFAQPLCLDLVHISIFSGITEFEWAIRLRSSHLHRIACAPIWWTPLLFVTVALQAFHAEYRHLLKKNVCNGKIRNQAGKIQPGWNCFCFAIFLLLLSMQERNRYNLVETK